MSYTKVSSLNSYVPLGIVPENENRGDEMVEIATHHYQFVPVEEGIEEHITYTRNVNVSEPHSGNDLRECE